MMMKIPTALVFLLLCAVVVAVTSDQKPQDHQSGSVDVGSAAKNNIKGGVEDAKSRPCWRCCGRYGCRTCCSKEDAQAVLNAPKEAFGNDEDVNNHQGAGEDMKNSGRGGGQGGQGGGGHGGGGQGGGGHGGGGQGGGGHGGGGQGGGGHGGGGQGGGGHGGGGHA